VLDLVESGRPIAEVAQVLGISAESIYTWRRQDRIDKGEAPGLSSVEKAELSAAKERAPSRPPTASRATADVNVLVGLDADDDSTPPRIGAHPCHCGLQLGPRVADATLAGRVDGTVTRPVAIRLR
jgi:hypothetical protein